MSTLTKAQAIAQAVIFDNAAIMQAWHASELSHLQLIGVDKQYRALPTAVWDEILATHLSLHPYIPEFFDCDGFSAVFMGDVLWNYEINGLARVIDFSAHHSYNAVLVCDDGKTCSWKKVEPQADQFVSERRVTSSKGHPDMYQAMHGFAVIA